MGVMVLVTEGGKFLLAKCAKRNRIHGKWIAMSGTIEEGETPEQTAVREMKEELNIEPRNFEKLGRVRGEIDPVLHVFRTDATGMEITPDERELSDLRAFTREEALKLDLGRGTRRVFEDLLNGDGVNSADVRGR